MVESRNELQEYSKRGILNLLDELIESWRERNNAQSMEPDYPPPGEPSKVFENVDKLLEYNNARVRYERSQRQVARYREQSAKRFDEVCERVSRVLPSGTRVVYAHRGMTESPGNTYTITHTSSGEIVISPYDPQGAS